MVVFVEERGSLYDCCPCFDTVHEISVPVLQQVWINFIKLKFNSAIGIRLKKLKARETNC